MGAFVVPQKRGNEFTSEELNFGSKVQLVLSNSMRSSGKRRAGADLSMVDVAMNMNQYMAEEIAQYRQYEPYLGKLPDLFDVFVVSEANDFKVKTQRENYCKAFCTQLLQKFTKSNMHTFSEFVNSYVFEEE